VILINIKTKGSNMTTTLNKIRDRGPCSEGWEKLLKSLGKINADDEPIDILYILESNGFEEALWCLRAVEGYDREIRLYAVWCVRQVEHLLTDKRSIDALNIAEKYANGQATDEELEITRDAAWYAVKKDSNIASVAIWSYVGDAAWSATKINAGEAAWGAANAANAADAANAQREQFIRMCKANV
jgi:hypothetical protein